MNEKTEALFRDLYEEIDRMPVVDTHEHLVTEKMRLDEGADFIATVASQYAGSDLVSAGMSEKHMADLCGKEMSFDEKIEIFMPYWEKTSNTAYCRAISIAARDLYEADGITRFSLPEINKRVAGRNKPGIYNEVLRDVLRIEYCLWDQFYFDEPAKDEFLRLSVRLDDIVFLNSGDDIKNLERKYNVSVSRIETLEEIMEILITESKPRGISALKSALAYSRTLDFGSVRHAEADLALEHMLRNRFSERDTKTLQDYLMYSLAQKAYWHNLTLQIHTGLLAGNGNVIGNANPAHLSQLILDNPGTRFDLFHGGYPYGGELASMAKMFPNVYLDMAWVHVISPVYARYHLSEWLESVPINKLLGFGGDYVHMEGVYGHLVIAKENIARVLAEKVADGVFSLGDSIRYAEMMLYKNPDELFRQG